MTLERAWNGSSYGNLESLAASVELTDICKSYLSHAATSSRLLVDIWVILIEPLALQATNRRIPSIRASVSVSYWIGSDNLNPKSAIYIMSEVLMEMDALQHMAGRIWPSALSRMSSR